MLASERINSENGEFGSGAEALGDRGAGFASSKPPTRQLH